MASRFGLRGDDVGINGIVQQSTVYMMEAMRAVFKETSAGHSWVNR
ncbi:MAG TPA: hypothetical protein VKV04_25530 [Verrucomicrobiae bacterium]|nr:hypothetical protein [Verrucomicrobiae bacterium]